MSALRPPKQGPGRPRKPQAPRTDAQVHLAAMLEQVSVERDAAAAAYRAAPSVATELALLSARMSVAAEWEAYLQATGDHTHALKYGDAGTKLASGITALRGLVMQDQLDQLDAQNSRESDVSRLVASEMSTDDEGEESL